VTFGFGKSKQNRVQDSMKSKSKSPGPIQGCMIQADCPRLPPLVIRRSCWASVADIIEAPPAQLCSDNTRPQSHPKSPFPTETNRTTATDSLRSALCHSFRRYIGSAAFATPPSSASLSRLTSNSPPASYQHVVQKEGPLEGIAGLFALL
jgi:hypothetical protein